MAAGLVAAALAAPSAAARTAPDAVAPAPGAPVERARFLMGTRLAIEARGPHAPDAIGRAFDEVARLEGVLSNWRADSEVSRLNALAAREPFACSADLFAAVTTALRWAETTGGAFDPTVEPLVRRLGLRGSEGSLPGTGSPAAAGVTAEGPAPIGWRLVRTDPAGRTVRFLAPGAGLDFGGLGKGIALDAAAAILERAGIASARLDFGGQALVFGAGPDDGGWRLGLTDPNERGRVVDTILLRSGSIATSGNAERGPGAPPHILDPATRAPAAWDGSVTVIASDATSADALSKALFVLGPERGLAYAAAHGLDVLYLRRDPDGTLQRRGRGAFVSGPAVTSTRSREADSSVHPPL